MKTIPPRRLTRDESKALTRRRLLDAARSVFLREGYHACTVDAVAEEAGFTKGAVYSTFAGKADLFLALYEERHRERREEYARLLRERGGRHGRNAGAHFWAESMRRDRDWHLLLIEFWVHAARDPELRRRFAALHAGARRYLAEAIEAVAREFGEVPPGDPERVARAHMALGNGYALEFFLDPDSPLDDEYRFMEAAFHAGLSTNGPNPVVERRGGDAS
jgi:AcrR family transcriptional regulator